MADLKLQAKERKDIELMAPLLQDALIPIASFHHDPDAKHFKCLLNRFCWENKLKDEMSENHERIHTSLIIHNVQKIDSTGFSPKDDKAHALNLLTLKYKAPYLHFIFSGKAELKVKTKDLHVKLTDYGHAWPAHQTPAHPEI